MTFEFLDQFVKRMKHVGMHALIHKNSMQKTTWKNYGFEKWDEQVNLIFMVLLFVMEKSLRDEPCTMDTVGEFVDDLNRRYLKKSLSYEACKEIGDFVINIILCDEGRAMYFEGFNFEVGKYEPIYISYIANEIVYVDGDVKRTAYRLTTEGYNFILATLEVETHLKLTIQEMVFRLHLERANYVQAVDDVKNIFNSLRIKLQEIQEAMRKIRQNALSYSVEDYKHLQEDTLGTLTSTKEKYEGYKQVVRDNIKKLEEEHINVRRLDDKQQLNLNHLRTIEGYLARAIEEQQRILGMHFDLKSLYEKELEGISAISLIKRFSFEKEVYEPLLRCPERLEGMEYFLRVLFNQQPPKTYNINLAYLEQKLVRRKKEEEQAVLLSFEEDVWQQEKITEQREKLKKYHRALLSLMIFIAQRGETTLKTLQEATKETGQGIAVLETIIPTVEIFREIMIELIKVKKVDFEAMKKETHYIDEEVFEFQLGKAFMTLIQEEKLFEHLKYLEVYRAPDQEKVIFSDLKSEQGRVNQVKCTNVVMCIGR